MERQLEAVDVRRPQIDRTTDIGRSFAEISEEPAIGHRVLFDRAGGAEVTMNASLMAKGAGKGDGKRPGLKIAEVNEYGPAVASVDIEPKARNAVLHIRRWAFLGIESDAAASAGTRAHDCGASEISSSNASIAPSTVSVCEAT